MTRRRMLMLAVAIAVLLLAVDFRGFFAIHSPNHLWTWMWALCGRLAKPLPMAMVTLIAALALPGNAARLPLVVNLAASLLLGMSVEWLHSFPLPSGEALAPVCFYAFLLWAVRRYCAARLIQTALLIMLSAVVLSAVVRALPGGPKFLPGVLAAVAVTAAYLWLLTDLVRRRAARAET